MSKIRVVGFMVVLAGILASAAPAAASQYAALGDSYSSGVGSRTFYQNQVNASAARTRTARWLPPPRATR